MNKTVNITLYTDILKLMHLNYKLTNISNIYHIAGRGTGAECENVFSVRQKKKY